MISDLIPEDAVEVHIDEVDNSARQVTIKG
jgi:hypothetical protein